MAQITELSSRQKKWIWLLVTVLSVAVWAWWATQERTQEQANHAVIGTWLAVADDAQYICALSIVPTDIKATEPVMLARFELRERRADGYEGVLAEPVAVTVSGDRLYAYIPTNEKDGTRIPVGTWNEADHTLTIRQFHFVQQDTEVRTSAELIVYMEQMLRARGWSGTAHQLHTDTAGKSGQNNGKK